MTVDEARLRLLGPNPTPARRRDFNSATSSAYVFLQVGDGVVAWESMGFSIRRSASWPSSPVTARSAPS